MLYKYTSVKIQGVLQFDLPLTRMYVIIVLFSNDSTSTVKYMKIYNVVLYSMFTGSWLIITQPNHVSKVILPLIEMAVESEEVSVKDVNFSQSRSLVIIDGFRI